MNRPHGRSATFTPKTTAAQAEKTAQMRREVAELKKKLQTVELYINSNVEIQRNKKLEKVKIADGARIVVKQNYVFTTSQRSLTKLAGATGVLVSREISSATGTYLATIQLTQGVAYDEGDAQVILPLDALEEAPAEQAPKATSTKPEATEDCDDLADSRLRIL